jgi:hypothetical protein
VLDSIYLFSEKYISENGYIGLEEFDAMMTQYYENGSPSMQEQQKGLRI